MDTQAALAQKPVARPKARDTDEVAFRRLTERIWAKTSLDTTPLEEIDREIDEARRQVRRQRRAS